MSIAVRNALRDRATVAEQGMDEATTRAELAEQGNSKLAEEFGKLTEVKNRAETAALTHGSKSTELLAKMADLEEQRLNLEQQNKCSAREAVARVEKEVREATGGYGRWATG